MNLLTKILAIFSIFSYFYAKFQGRKSEKTKRESMLLDDVITAQKIDNGVDDLSDVELDSKLRVFARKASVSSHKANNSKRK